MRHRTRTRIMTPRIITIPDIVQKGYASMANYRNEVLVSSGISRLQTLTEPCRFESTVVFVCLSGKLDFSINTRSFSVEGPSVAVAFPGDVVKIDNCEDLEGYSSIFAKGYLDGLEIELLKRDNFKLHVSACPVGALTPAQVNLLKPFYTMCKTIMDRGFPETPAIMRGLAQAFCHVVFSIMKEARAVAPGLKATGRRRQIFNMLINLVATHHATRRDVEFYAASLGLSAKYLSVSVRECTGRSPQDWINDYVLMDAKSMLRNSSASVKEIAFALNFSTQSAFGKFFRQHAGASPRQYRKNNT